MFTVDYALAIVATTCRSSGTYFILPVRDGRVAQLVTLDTDTFVSAPGQGAPSFYRCTGGRVAQLVRALH